MTTIRQQRVSSLLFEELSILIGGELADPNITMVQVSDVVISKDLRNAKVYVSHDDESVPQGAVLASLRRATPFLRGELATRLGLRSVPELLFYYDDTPERSARISELLEQIAAEREQQPNATESDNTGKSDYSGDTSAEQTDSAADLPPSTE